MHDGTGGAGSFRYCSLLKVILVVTVLYGLGWVVFLELYAPVASPHEGIGPQPASGASSKARNDKEPDVPRVPTTTDRAKNEGKGNTTAKKDSDNEEGAEKASNPSANGEPELESDNGMPHHNDDEGVAADAKQDGKRPERYRPVRQRRPINAHRVERQRAPHPQEAQEPGEAHPHHGKHQQGKGEVPDEQEPHQKNHKQHHRRAEEVDQPEEDAKPKHHRAKSADEDAGNQHPQRQHHHHHQHGADSDSNEGGGEGRPRQMERAGGGGTAKEHHHGAKIEASKEKEEKGKGKEKDGAPVHKHRRHRFHGFANTGDDASDGNVTLPADLKGTQVAYAVVVSNEEFIDGALTLGWSFLRQSKYVRAGLAEMVVIVPRGSVSDLSIQRLHAAGWGHVVVVEDLGLKAPRAAWSMTFNKLYLFNLTMYSRVACFDVDMLMIADPDGVFGTKLESASWIGALGMKPKPGQNRKPYFQTGMMLIVPSQEIFTRMLTDFEVNPVHKTVNGRDGALIRSVFQGNFVQLNEALSAHLDPMEPLDGVIGFHFRGDWKPWYDVEKPPAAGAKSQHGNKAVAQEMGLAYRMWWEHYEDLHRQEFVKLDGQLSLEQQADAPGGKYDPKTQIWMMRRTSSSYLQYLSSYQREVVSNLTHPGLVLEMSQSGESCDAVCAIRQFVCLEEALTFSEVNNCDRLKSLFGCSACTVDPPMAAAPGFLSDKLVCATNPMYMKGARPTCSAVVRGMRRLCPCVSLDTAYQAAVPYSRIPGGIPLSRSGNEGQLQGAGLEEAAGLKATAHHLADGVSPEEDGPLCDPTRSDWFSNEPLVEDCVEFLSDPNNIESVEPLARSKGTGRTVKLIATYKVVDDPSVFRKHLRSKRSGKSGRKGGAAENDAPVDQGGLIHAPRRHAETDPDRLAKEEGLGLGRATSSTSPSIRIKAILKFPQKSFPHEAQSEVAAFGIDRLLGIYRVPPTTFVYVAEEVLKKGFRNITVPRVFDVQAAVSENDQVSGDIGNQNAEGDPSAKGQKGKGREGAAAAQKAKNFGAKGDDLVSMVAMAEKSSKLSPYQVAEKEIWDFLSGLENEGTTAGYTVLTETTNKLKVGVSVQLWMYNLHRLADTGLKVGDVGDWLAGKLPSTQEFPHFKQSLHELSLMSALDYAIGNEERGVGKNCFVQGLCERHCGGPAALPQELAAEVHAPRVILLDQGQGFYPAPTRVVDDPEGNLITQVVRSTANELRKGGKGAGGGDGEDENQPPEQGKSDPEKPARPSSSALLCRFPLHLYTTLLETYRFSATPTESESDPFSRLKDVLPRYGVPENVLKVIGETALDAADKRLGRLTEHLRRCRRLAPDDQLLPWI
jgi:hypothetical protein